MTIFRTGDLVIAHNNVGSILQVVDKEMDDTGRVVYKVDTKEYCYPEDLKPAPHYFNEDGTESADIKTIIVTGGAGYVGSLLVRKLLQNNYRVICIDNLRFGGASLIDICCHPQFWLENIDINDFAEVDRVVEKSNCYGIIHLAAIVGDPACKLEPEVAAKTNWDSSIHLIDKALQSNIERFIFASTCSNYGKMSGASEYVDESSPLAPVSLYAELKVKVEDYLLNKIEKKHDFSPTCLRFATVYGMSPRMRFDLTVNEFTKELALGRELLVFGEQFWRPYCHVSDFSRAMLTVLRQPKEKVAYNVFNVGDSLENYTKKMIVDELLKLMPKGRIKYIEKSEDPRDYRVNFDKIKDELGFLISKKVPEGMEEILRSIQNGVVDKPDREVFYNTPI
ncbi:SDR family oxidoreductase [Halomonas sp. CS7]|uniref:SDR family oxidoreductase n=1 Tax=Halomonas pelophila TaxID=3151122 RepID=A0ABV1N9V1_9GAMM